MKIKLKNLGVSGGLLRLLPVCIAICLFCFDKGHAQNVKTLEQAYREQDEKKNVALKSLIHNVQPSIYLEQGGALKQYGGAPKVAYVDGSQLSNLNTLESFMPGLELIVVKVNDPKQFSIKQIDVNVFASGTNLKNVLLEFGYKPCDGNSVDCIVSQLKSIVGKANTNINFLVSYPPKG